MATVWVQYVYSMATTTVPRDIYMVSSNVLASVLK